MAELALFGGSRAVTEPIPEYLPVDADEEHAVLESLRRVPLTTLYGGYDVAALESGFSRRFGFDHCVAMSSGTASLHAAVAALGIGPGDEVITPTYSFVASVSVVVQQGATPVFCDIEARTLGLDVAACADLINERTRAVIAVHVCGMPMEIGPLAALCRRAGIGLIEDCAGSIGARYDGRSVGGFGDVGCFSFNVHKIFRTGEGGMASTQDASLRDILLELRVNGLNPHHGVNHVNRLGFNYTMAQPIAALGCAQLRRFDEQLARRAQNREQLRAGCRGLPVSFLDDPPKTESVGYWTVMLLEPDVGPLRDRILQAANAEGVRLSPGYGEPLHRIGYLTRYAKGLRFPVSEELSRRLMVFDPSPYLGTSAIEQQVAGIHKVFDNLDRLK